MRKKDSGFYKPVHYGRLKKKRRFVDSPLVLHGWNPMRYHRRSSMHNPSSSRMPLIKFFFCKRRRKKTSTRSIGCETTSGRLRSSSRIRNCGMSQCIKFVGFAYLVCYRDEDFRRFNQREDDIKLMQSQYRQMQMRLESMEGVKAELEDNARYLWLFLF